MTTGIHFSAESKMSWKICRSKNVACSCQQGLEMYGNRMCLNSWCGCKRRDLPCTDLCKCDAAKCQNIGKMLLVFFCLIWKKILWVSHKWGVFLFSDCGSDNEPLDLSITGSAGFHENQQGKTKNLRSTATAKVPSTSATVETSHLQASDIVTSTENESSKEN